MTRVGVVVAVAALAGAVFSVVRWSPSLASFSSGGSVLDTNIVSSARLETSITNEWVPVAGGPLGERLEVDIPNPITLTPQTLALLAGERTCQYTPIDNPLLDGGTLIFIRRVAGQTAVDLEAHDFGALVDFVSCWPGTFDAGPYANCLIGDGGVGYALHNHGEVSWDITDSTEVSCIACVHGSNIAQQRAVMAGGVVGCVPSF